MKIPIDQIALRNLVIDFNAVYYPESKIVFICGSAALQKQYESSDLDLLILSETVNKPFSEQHSFRGIVFSIMILPLFKMKALIRKEHQDRQCIYTELLWNSILITDNDNIGKRIRDYCGSLLQKGPASLNKEEMKYYTTRISNGYFDLDSERNYLENMFIFIRTTDLLTYLILVANKFWPKIGKARARALQKIDGSFEFQHKQAMENFMRTQNVEPLKLFVQGYMERYGGLVRDYSSRLLPDKVFSNKLIIRITDKQNLLSYDLLVKEVVVEIKDIFKGEWYFTIESKNTSSETAILIIIFDEQESLNSILIPAITNTFRLSQFSRYNIDFPISIADDEFDSHEVERLCNLTLKKVSSHVLTISREDDSLSGETLKLFFYFLIVAFNSRAESFTSFLLEYWLSDVIDNRTEYGMNRLEERKIIVFKQYETSYNNQQKGFFTLINNFYASKDNNAIYALISKLFFELPVAKYSGKEELTDEFFEEAAEILARILGVVGVKNEHKLFYAYMFNKYFSNYKSGPFIN